MLDFILIQRIRNHDTEASEIFVEKYYALIFKYILFKLKNRCDAEDLTQETFIKFFGNIDRYNEYGKAKNYLYVIAGNLCKNYWKKRGYLKEKEEALKNEKRYIEALENFEIKADVERAFEKLPLEIREVAILFFIQELKQKEIATILGIKLSLVKYRVSRAKVLLKKYLEE